MLWATSTSTYKMKSPLLPFLSPPLKIQQQMPISFLTTVINISNIALLSLISTYTEFCPMNVFMGFVMVFRTNINYFPNSINHLAFIMEKRLSCKKVTISLSTAIPQFTSLVITQKLLIR